MEPGLHNPSGLTGRGCVTTLPVEPFTTALNTWARKWDDAGLNFRLELVEAKGVNLLYTLFPGGSWRILGLKAGNNRCLGPVYLSTDTRDGAAHPGVLCGRSVEDECRIRYPHSCNNNLFSVSGI